MMRRMRLLVALGMVVMATTLVMAAKAKISVNINENFSFAGPFTYAWTAPTGEIKMLQVAENNPDRWRLMWDPTIVSSVNRELAARKYTVAPLETADIKAGQDFKVEGESSAKLTSSSPSNYDAPIKKIN